MTRIRSLGGPDYRDLYLLMIGLIGGILLGPFVLGRISPAVYDRMSGIGPAKVGILDSLRQQMNNHQSQLAQTDVSEVAKAEQMVLDLAHQHQNRKSFMAAHLSLLRARAMALMFAMIVIMVLETFVSPRNRLLRGRLASTRYALCAIWIAIVLAQPQLLAAIPFIFVMLLVVVGITAALVPLGKWSSQRNG